MKTIPVIVVGLIKTDRKYMTRVKRIPVIAVGLTKSDTKYMTNSLFRYKHIISQVCMITTSVTMNNRT